MSKKLSRPSGHTSSYVLLTPNNRVLNKYISRFSIAVYFYGSCSNLASQNTNDEEKYTAICGVLIS